MNWKTKGRVFLAVVLAVVVSALVNWSEAAQGQTKSVSIPSLPITSKERVGGFEIHVTSGRIAAIRNVPIGWNVCVDNDPSWKAVIKGSLTVGAAAVDAEYFKNFLLIEKNESLGRAPFDVQGEIVVSEDFATERRIKIGIKDIVMKNVVAPNSKKRRSGS